MAEQDTTADADTPLEWESFRTFDEQGRLLTLAQFPVAKQGVCADCHGSGRVMLLTSSKSCPLCLGSGKRIITLNRSIVKTYECEPGGESEQSAQDLGEDAPNPAPPAHEKNL